MNTDYMALQPEAVNQAIVVDSTTNLWADLILTCPDEFMAARTLNERL